MKIFPPELTNTEAGRNSLAAAAFLFWMWLGFMPLINAASNLANGLALLSLPVASLLYYHFVMVPFSKRKNN
jgi:hypothetical protein